MAAGMTFGELLAKRAALAAKQASVHKHSSCAAKVSSHPLQLVQPAAPLLSWLQPPRRPTSAAACLNWLHAAASACSVLLVIMLLAFSTKARLIMHSAQGQAGSSSKQSRLSKPAVCALPFKCSASPF